LSDADATLLRSYRLLDSAFTPSAKHGLFASVRTDPDQERHIDHTSRNSYYRFRSINRLGNLVTKRSNVYAIWITVGYFEAEPVVGQTTIYPDGYRFGKEIGEDTGRIKRHRAFYIVDRSLPVAYEPGQDHNVEEIVRLRRYIE
jgi:hypothetical protein